MTGRLADLFRLAWGLLYWNARKSWFRLRRGQVRCPCQSPSDSGRAGETGCEACVHWAKPERFRRVCPLLVPTTDGLRCSVDTADVRPFWGRAAGFYGGTALGLYLAGALAIFAFLRTVGYPISIVHLVWPGSWHRVGEVRGWFFMERANRAFQGGRPAEGMLYLRNAYEFDPGNIAVALAIAQKLQLNQSAQADEIYRQLARDHPDQRAAVSRIWFRALLARGDFPAVQELAKVRLLDDVDGAAVWMRALIFATRQTGDRQPLEDLIASTSPRARPWRPLLDAELLQRPGQRHHLRAVLDQRWSGAPGYALYYQVEELIRLGDGFAAVDLLGAYGAQLDDTARASLLLEAYTAMTARQSRQRLLDTLLEPPLTAAKVNLVCTHLVRHPDPAALDTLYNRFHDTALTDQTLDAFLALYCASGVAGDWTKMHALAPKLLTRPAGNTLTVNFVEAFFRGQTTQTRATSVLPALPLSLEMTYAMLERYPGPKTAPTPSAR